MRAIRFNFNMKTRLKFHFTGVCLYEELIKSTLIAAGYEWTTQMEEADFNIAGMNSFNCSRKPTVILSYGAVYSSIDSSMKVSAKPFSESDYLVVPSTGEYGQVDVIYQEAYNRSKFPNHSLLRIFDVYGPQAGGHVGSFLYSLEHGDPIRIQLSPHRTVSCLYEDDFKAAFLKFIEVFVTQEVRGLYNLGHDQGITFGHLADTVHQAWHSSKDKAQIEITESAHFVNFHEVPDMTRFCALTGWQPKISLRMGVWLTVQHEKLQRK